MKLEKLSVDPKSKSGYAKIIPQNDDDIYCLSKIILPGDKVSSHTTRKVSLDGGKTQKKISLKLEIKVESLDVSFESNGIIFIKGKTSIENEYIKIGSYHTLDISPETEFYLSKNCWAREEMTTLKECSKEVPEVLFLVFYEKDCVMSIVSSNGVNQIYKEELKNKNFKELINQIAKNKDKVKSIVIASMSEVRNDFHKALVKEHQQLSKMVSIIKLSSSYKGLPNSKVVSKVLTDKDHVSSLNNVAFAEDLKEAQKLFNALDLHTEEVSIGLKEVGEAMEYGAIKVLFVTDLFKKPKTLAERDFTESFIKKASELRAKICVVPISLDLGERLHNIGGVACTLSFNYK